MSSYSNYTDSEKRRRLLIYVGVGAVLLVICATTLYMFLRPAAETDVGTTPGGIVYDVNAVEGGWETLSEEEIVASLNEKVEEGYINISMNASPVFEDGQAEGSLMIVNEEVNRYPQQVVITRDDTGETIYTSAAIPVGSKIAADALDVVLPAGTYECTAMFHSLDPETGAILGSAGASIVITIQN